MTQRGEISYCNLTSRTSSKTPNFNKDSKDEEKRRLSTSPSIWFKVQASLPGFPKDLLDACDVMLLCCIRRGGGRHSSVLTCRRPNGRWDMQPRSCQMQLQLFSSENMSFERWCTSSNCRATWRHSAHSFVGYLTILYNT